MASIYKRSFLRFITTAIILTVASGSIASYYLLKNAEPESDSNGLSQSRQNAKTLQSPSPTPTYMGLINRNADYVGKIGSVDNTNIELIRDDGSRILLSVQPDIMVYQYSSDNGSSDIHTRDLNHLEVGMTLSVYSEGNQITALFLSPN